jgi:hypothetical protein
MTGILSAISGQFSKSLILGAFLPTIIFVTLSMIFLIPLFPTDWPVLAPLVALDAQWKIIVLTLITVTLSGVLYNLNVPLIRLYEGYPWKDSWLGKWRTRHYEARFALVSSRWSGMRALLLKLPDDDPRKEKISGLWAKIGQEFNNDFAGNKELILPTRLGNAIRSFEYYPNHQYGIDDVALWPRMIAKIDKEYAAVIDDAKTSFDFMLNNSFLFAVLSLSLLLVGLIYPGQLASPGRTVRVLWIIEVLICVGLAYYLYRMSVGRAKVWGDTVKAAYDLYRWELLEQLGYKQKPVTRADEVWLWQNITKRLIYGKPPGKSDMDYNLLESSPGLPASLSVKPDRVRVNLTRGVIAPRNDQAMTIFLHVQNLAKDKDAAKVTIKDTLPEGFDYEWGSVNPRNVPVTGINPYSFEIGPLAHEAEFTLTYRALARPQKCCESKAPATSHENQDEEAHGQMSQADSSAQSSAAVDIRE